MSGRASRRKGAEGEREVARIFSQFGFTARRTPNSGGLAVKADLTGALGEAVLPGKHIEVKRCETILLPAWLRQAWAASAGAVSPVVIFRRSKGERNDPLGRWHVVEPLDEWLGDQEELKSLREILAAREEAA